MFLTGLIRSQPENCWITASDITIRQNSVLTALSLNGNDLTAQGADLTRMHGLIVGLHANRSLAKLSVSIGGGWQLGYIVDVYIDDGDVKLSNFDGIVSLANAIKNLVVLSSLDISNTRLQADGAKILAPALKVIYLPTLLNLLGLFQTLTAARIRTCLCWHL